MSKESDLVERSGTLKQGLVAFGLEKRWRRELNRARLERYGSRGTATEAEAIELHDYFILQHRFEGGEGLIDHFLASRPKLSERERAMVLGWKDTVHGIFEVLARRGDAIEARNLIDELTYVVRSNAGPSRLAPMKPGMFLVTRIMPVEDDWVLSGATNGLPSSSRGAVLRAVEEMKRARPAAVFRNPEKLAAARERQAHHYRAFVEHFGSEYVTVPGAEVADTMQGYFRYLNQKIWEEHHGPSSVPPGELMEPTFKYPAEVAEAESVGIVFDEVDGIGFLRDFKRIEAIFQHPELAGERTNKDLLLGYLRDDAISPRVIERLAEKDPERASRVFRLVLKRAGFSWQRDGNALLHRYKARYYASPVYPSITMISTPADAARTADGGK